MRRLPSRLIAAVTAALLLTLAVWAGTASAKPKIYKSVPTRVQLSVTRAGDGTITARVSYLSNDPRCLAAKRFKRAGAKNLYPNISSTLLFGGPYTANGEEFPAGAKGFARPPNEGTFDPVSSFGKSPLVWENVMPGDTPLAVTNPQSNSERHYTATVADASELQVFVAAPVSKGQGLPYFKVAYNQGGKRIIEKCEPLAKATIEGFAGKYLERDFLF